MTSTDSPDSTKIKVIDLFAGCGGFTEGFHSFRPNSNAADEPVFRTVAAVEHNLAAAATYAANFAAGMGGAQHIHAGDIEDWFPKGDEIEADVILGGPPCQGFSGLGKQDAADPRNKLWRQYMRIINDVEPKIFVIENVDRFLRSPEFADLQAETEEGGELHKYRLIDPPGAVKGEPADVRAKRYLLNSADYGVPQTRRRAIVIGVLRDVPELANMKYPVPTHTGGTGKDTLFSDQDANEGPKGWNTVQDVFARSRRQKITSTELKRAGEDRSVDVEALGLSISAGNKRKTMPGPYRTVDLHIGRNPEVLSLARYRAIDTGGNRKHLRDKFYKVATDGAIHLSTESGYESIPGEEHYLSTESWDSHNTGSGDVMGRLVEERPSVTIRTEFYKPEKGRYLHPKEHRPITHLEAALIQGFPPDFEWHGTKVEIARQIGNAVPVGLGRAIAGAIHDCLRGSTENTAQES
ncbi:DNA cytosine methyltransferase [Kitasatospora indigofera]|uniref:DNA cytosine methyltransferase n=1 Tax=Kitasatospora indigofera TaxID=67307 RepID=UPI00367CE4C3